VTGPGDENIQLVEEEGVEGTDTAVIMMPASIKKQYKQLYFRIFRGENLPQTDMLGTIDAYLETTFFKQNLKTQIVTMKDKLVQWDQEMLLPVQWPVASNRLVFKLYDYNKASADELIGSMVFSIKDII
jgi:Ca2+-dependent lipid-binding protein